MKTWGPVSYVVGENNSTDRKGLLLTAKLRWWMEILDELGQVSHSSNKEKKRGKSSKYDSKEFIAGIVLTEVRKKKAQNNKGSGLQQPAPRKRA